MNKIFSFLFFLGVFAFADGEKQVKKFEDLFIWRVSEELKLNHDEEVAVTDVIKDTNKKKQQSNQELDELYRKLKSETTDGGRKKVFASIHTALKNQGNLPVEELDRLNKAIGLKKVALYLEIKRDLSDKIKSIWTADKKGEKALPPPKVIEEK